MKSIIFIVGIIVSMHVFGFIGILIREWWVFRKAKKFKKAKNEAMYQLHSKEEWDASKKRVEERDQLIKILRKATTNHGEGNYDFNLSNLSEDEFKILKAYAIARKKELDSYIDLCNTISNEPEADCTQDLKDIYGFDVAGLLDYVCSKQVENGSTRENNNNNEDNHE